MTTVTKTEKTIDQKLASAKAETVFFSWLVSFSIFVLAFLTMAFFGAQLRGEAADPTTLAAMAFLAITTSLAVCMVAASYLTHKELLAQKRAR